MLTSTLCASRAESPVMECVSDLLFKPKDTQKKIGEPLTADEFPAELLSSALFPGASNPQTDMVFASRRSHDGLLGIYTSPSFEKVVCPQADIESVFLQNEKPMLGLIFPPEELQKVCENLLPIPHIAHSDRWLFR